MALRSQENHYGGGYDYLTGSPHLKHRHLYDLLTGRIAAIVCEFAERRETVDVLEVGAGDGAVTERLLALGCDVTATEMSRHSIEAMDSRFGSNDRLHTAYDPDGTLNCVGDREFDVVLFSSVLHHIPDYLAALSSATERHLRPGGALITTQDPLWYPRMSSASLKLTRASYLSWRITQGGLVRGLKTRLRRGLRGLSEEAPGDVVEYHVVRDGVDDQAIDELLTPRFDKVEIFSYWSSQGGGQQRLGERLGMVNTFAVFATGHRGSGKTA